MIDVMGQNVCQLNWSRSKARMIRDHLSGVMTYFTHRIINAVAEDMNSKIATIQKMAYGFRNKEHFKTAIYFRCGNLQLYPEIH